MVIASSERLMDPILLLVSVLVEHRAQIGHLVVILINCSLSVYAGTLIAERPSDSRLADRSRSSLYVAVIVYRQSKDFHRRGSVLSHPWGTVTICCYTHNL